MSDLTKQFQNTGLSKKELEKLILNKDWQTIFDYRVDWDCISFYQTLSEELIERNKDLVNWKHISEYQVLSEEFIERNKDLVNWKYISFYQEVSDEFRLKHNLN
jgi:hypothetical protein